MNIEIESRIERAKEKSRRYSRRKQREAMDVELKYLEHKHLRHFMLLLCEEYGQRVNLQWTGKTRGSAQNFIDYCVENDEDPREIMREVIKNWPQFVEGAIIGVASGKILRFSQSVDFDEFFKFRKEIMDWIRHGGAGRGQGKYTFKEINLRGEKT